MSPRTLFVAALAAIVLAAAPALGQEGSGEEKPSTPPPSAAGPVYVLMTTSKGEIVVELDPVKAPKSVENFLSYVDKEFYNGTIFHRVINDFMIQGGGFTKDMQKKATDAPVVNEWRNGLKNARGTIALARLRDKPDSATSQFFISVKDNEFLDRPQSDGAAYAVFGRVIAGMDVVDKIKVVETRTVGAYSDVPAEPVIIEKVARISADDAKKKSEKTSDG